MEENFKVYCHENKINGKKYFGITKQEPERRWRNGNGYSDNRYFSFSIEKYGWDNFNHIVILEGLSKEEVFEIEKYLIKKYDTMNDNNGYNLSEGGEFNKLSKASRIKLSNSLKGKIPHNKGIPNSEETRRKISISLRKLDRKITREQILKTSRRIIQLSINGDFIKHWEIMSEASNELNINLASICQCCNRRFKTAGGFIFLYEEDYNKITEKELDILVYKANNNPVDRQVVQISKDGIFINKFNNISEASRKTNSNNSNISSCCQQKSYYANGFIWMYLEDYNTISELKLIQYSKNIKEKIKHNRKIGTSKSIVSNIGKRDKKIIQMDDDLNFIKQWSSIKFACDSLKIGRCHIADCCKGRRNKTGGFKWMYYEDYIEKYGEII